MTLDPGTESTLIAQARAGSSAAFETIYRHHVGRVYAICLRLARSPDRATDLTQEAFVRAWRNLPSFRGESRLGSWLHRIAVTTVLGDLRERAHEPIVETGIEALMIESRRAMPDTNLDLERALAALPTGARETVILRDVEGYSYAEIAGMLGISEGTVKSQIHRGRRLIREVMER